MQYLYRNEKRDQAGVALLIAVMLMLLISAIGLSALQSAGVEASASGRSARKLRTFFAADSALSMVMQRLDPAINPFPDTRPLDEQQFMQNPYGGFTQVRTGTADSDVPQSVQLVRRVRREGNQLNVNAGNAFSAGIYRVDILATDPAGGRVELQAQYSIDEGQDGYI